MKTTGPLVLIDGMNMILRNYFRSPYLNANGERAGGTSGMIVSVRKVIADFRASNCLIVWDGEGGSQRRKNIYSEYKAGRTVRFNKREDDMEEDPKAQLENLRKQLTDAQEYLTMLGIPQVRADGVEADDLIAYIAGKMDHPGGVVIVTTDQDMLQLVRKAGPMHAADCDLVVNKFSGMCDCPPPQSEVRVYSPVKKVMYDRETFISEYGVLPENFRLVKALTGDKSDNIEGIRGFGPKTVAKAFPFLLEARSDHVDVINQAAFIGGVVGKRLAENESRFLENLRLVDLSVPMLSATAARQARDALRADLGCKEVDFRIRIVRDGVSFKGDGFVNVFRELVHRRRRLLAETKVADPVDAGEAADAGGLPTGGDPPVES
jgi:DNA polymerase-1